MQHTHPSELLVSGLIHILPTISVMFLKHELNFRDMKRLINALHMPTCIFMQFPVTATQLLYGNNR